MQYYTLFEVIECSWSNFTKRVQSAKALDDILQAHGDFLNEVRVGTFLDSKTKDTLYLHLDIVYDSIMKLEEWQRTFYDIACKECNDRKKFEDAIVESEKSGTYGVTTEKKFERDQEKKVFEQSVSTLKKSLDGIGQSYEKSVNAFLLMLNSSKDQNLQLFGTRLDFNEYYKNKDKRLKKPLTYEHMRLSGMGHSGVFGRTSMSNTIMYQTSPRLAYGSQH
jgi:gamma-tubulin complex component 3